MKYILIILLFWTNFVHAATRYVDSDFTGTSTGTITNPYKTLSAALSASGNGDIILLKRGTVYTNGQVNWNLSGVTLDAYGTGAKPVFKGNGSTLNALFYLASADNNTFRNFIIIDSTIAQNDLVSMSKIQRSFYFDTGASGNVIDNCEIYRTGVALYTPGNNNTIQYSIMRYGKMIVNTPGGVDDYGANGVILEGDNNRVMFCIITDMYAESLDFGFDGGGIEFFNNNATTNGCMIFGNFIYNCNGLTEMGTSNTGEIANDTFAYNVLINNENAAYLQTSGSFASTISGIKFYNNTFVHNSAGRLSETRMFAKASGAAQTNAIELKNNIFYLNANSMDMVQSGAFTSGQFAHTNNLYFFGTGSTANYTLDGTEQTTSAQIWVSQSGAAQNWNYNIGATSPARNLGTIIFPIDITGQPSTTDVGAYAYRTGITTFRSLLKFIQ